MQNEEAAMQVQWEYKTLRPGGVWFIDFRDLEGTSYGPFSDVMLNRLGKEAP